MKWAKTLKGQKYYRDYQRSYSKTEKGRQALWKLRLRMWKRKYLLLIDIKNRPCADCQGWFEPCQMDFDHVKGEKLFTLNTAISRSLKKVWYETKKCDLVCANCHRLRTFKRRQNVHKGNIPRCSYGNELQAGTSPNETYVSRPPSLRDS